MLKKIKKSKLIRIIKWLWTNYWPFLLVVLVFLLHVFYTYTDVFKFMSDYISITKFNDGCASICSIIGAVIIVLSVSNNLRTLKGEGWRKHFKKKLDSFPGKRQQVSTIYATQTNIAAPCHITVTAAPLKEPITIESLHEYVKKLDQLHSQEIESLHMKINKDTQDLKNTLIEEQLARAKQLQTIEKKLINISVDNVDTDLFGVLLVILGAYLNLY